jgi:RNA polymerase sigma-70 factor (ECF subfamily)
VSRSVELELLRHCQAGESRFYEPLVRAYERPALRAAVSLLGDPDDARDAVQDAFVRAYKSLSRFDLERPFAPWYFRILRNVCRDRLRQRKPRFEVGALERTLAADAASGPERDHERAAARALLWRGLERIGAEHREVLVLKEIDGFSYAELAEVLEIPEGTVASRLYHARRALRDALRELGVTSYQEAS